MKDNNINSAFQAPPEGPLDDDEIISLLRQKRERAINRDETEVSAVREKALNYYRGGPIGEETEERSKFRSREVFDAVEWALPSLMSTFFSAKQPIVFEPVGPEDVDQAEQETDATNYYLFQRENSFIQFHNFFKSALLDPAAYAKIHVCTKEQTIAHNYKGLDDQALQTLMQGRKFKDYKVEPFIKDGVRYHKFEGVEVREVDEFVFEALPPEQVLVERGADYLDLDEVFDNFGMICHWSRVSYSDLVARGYDADKLQEIPADGDEDERENTETESRNYREGERDHSHVSDYAGRMYKVYEHYLKLDSDGDGIAESRKVVVIGDTIFEDSLTEYMPIVATSAIPMPFKHSGISLAESLFGQQEVSTKLWRMLLDNLYDTEPKWAIDRRALSGNKGTIDALRDPEEKIVITNGDPNGSIRSLTMDPVTEPILATHQRVNEETARRSGISPDNALNPDVIRDATAHGMLASMDKTSQRLMHLARLLGETGVKKVARKMHTLLRMYCDKPLMLRLRGKFVPVDPSTWLDRPNVMVTVGLGFNSKEQRTQALMQVLQQQMAAMGQGGADATHIGHTLSELIESNDLGFFSEFFFDPKVKPWQPPPPQPDPTVVMQKEIEQMKQQSKMAELQTTMKRAEMERDVKLAEIETMKAKIAAEARKMDFEEEREDVLIIERKQAEIEELIAKRDKLMMETRKLEAEVDETRAGIAKMQKEGSKLEAEAAAIRNPPPEEKTNEGKQARREDAE